MPAPRKWEFNSKSANKNPLHISFRPPSTRRGIETAGVKPSLPTGTIKILISRLYPAAFSARTIPADF